MSQSNTPQSNTPQSNTPQSNTPQFGASFRPTIREYQNLADALIGQLRFHAEVNARDPAQKLRLDADIETCEEFVDDLSFKGDRAHIWLQRQAQTATTPVSWLATQLLLAARGQQTR